MYKCRICSKEFSEIPPDAVEIAAKRRGVLYQFGGTVHDLRQHKPMSMEEHKHKHRKTPRSNCRFCNPLTWAAEQTLLQEALEPNPNPNPPVEQPALVQEAPVPELKIEEVKPGVVTQIEPEEIEDELAAITSLAAAFNRIRK